MWDESPTEHAVHEVCIYLKAKRHARDAAKIICRQKGEAPAPAKLDVFRVVDAATLGAIVKVNTGVSVVRLEWYNDDSGGGARAESHLLQGGVLLLAWRRTTTNNISGRGLVCEDEVSVFFFLGLFHLVVLVQDQDAERER